MARKRSQEKRETYLSAALRLFVEKGVQNTATADIARAAGTAAGTLFLYFPTKQDLVHALVLDIAREQSRFIHSLLQPSASALDMFVTIWNGSLDWFIAHPDAYAYIQQVRDSGIIADAVVQESNQFFDYYYHAIQQGLREGSIRPYPAELIGGVLYQALVAVMNLIRAQPVPAAQAEYSRLGFAIFWNGIQTG